MPKLRVLATDHGFPNLRHEETAITAAGAELVVAQCKTAEDVIAAAKDMDALLVQWSGETESDAAVAAS